MINTNGNYGIGISPTARLHVDGTLRFSDNGEGLGKVLTSDEFGNAIWSDTNGITGSGISNYITMWDSSSSIINGSWLFSGNDILPVTNGSNIGNSSSRISTIFLNSVIDHYSDLTFTNSGSTNFTFTTDGKLGIGVVPGSFQLYVNGNTRIDGNIRYNDGNQGSGKVLTSDTDGVATWQNVGGLLIGTSSITTGVIGRLLYQGVGNVLQQDGDLFWDESNTRIGIGTSTPTNTLDLTVSGTGKGFVLNSGSTSCVDIITNLGADVLLRFKESSVTKIQLCSTAGVNSYVSADGSSFGIGATNPNSGYALTLNAQETPNDWILFTRINNTLPYASFKRLNNTFTILGDAGTLGLSIGSGVFNQSIFTQTSDGFVGINKNTPTAQLNIKGTGGSSASYVAKFENVSTEFLGIRDDLRVIYNDGSQAVTGINTTINTSSLWGDPFFNLIGSVGVLSSSSRPLTTFSEGPACSFEMVGGWNNAAGTAALRSRITTYSDLNRMEIAIQSVTGARMDFLTDATLHMTLLSNGKFGIGTDTPTEKLHISGSIRIVDGNHASGKVLTSDVNGVGTWQTPLTSLGVTGSGTTNYAVKWGSTSSVDNGTWAFSGNTYYPVTDGSNIGLSGSNRVGTIFLASNIDFVNDLNFMSGGIPKHIFKTDGSIQVNGATSSGRQLDIRQNNATISIGSYTANTSYTAIYANQPTPGLNNYAFLSNGNETYLSGTSDVRILVNNVLKFLSTSTYCVLNSNIIINSSDAPSPSNALTIKGVGATSSTFGIKHFQSDSVTVAFSTTDVGDGYFKNNLTIAGVSASRVLFTTTGGLVTSSSLITASSTGFSVDGSGGNVFIRDSGGSGTPLTVSGTTGATSRVQSASNVPVNLSDQQNLSGTSKVVLLLSNGPNVAVGSGVSIAFGFTNTPTKRGWIDYVVNSLTSSTPYDCRFNFSTIQQGIVTTPLSLVGNKVGIAQSLGYTPSNALEVNGTASFSDVVITNIPTTRMLFTTTGGLITSTSELYYNSVGLNQTAAGKFISCSNTNTSGIVLSLDVNSYSVSATPMGGLNSAVRISFPSNSNTVQNALSLHNVAGAGALIGTGVGIQFVMKNTTMGAQIYSVVNDGVSGTEHTSLVFKTLTSGTVSTPLQLVKNTVGIGYVSGYTPSSVLDVRGSGITSSTFGIKHFQSDASTLAFSTTDAGDGYFKGSVGIGTNTQPNDIMLDVVGTSSGSRFNQMTNIQRLALGTSSIGMLVFVTDITAEEGYWQLLSTGWVQL